MILLDVEGYDSSSRQVNPQEEVKGERNIEDKLALFVLLASDVIIINLMVNDCGNYQASGMKTLETIFKAAQQLPREQRLRTKKKILFFVRDVTRQTIEVITNTIKTRLNEVYARNGLVESEISELINIDFYAFHPYGDPDFFAEAEAVKSLFTQQKLLSDFPGMPARFIAETLETNWDVVCSNEELNLPDVRSMKNIWRLKEIKDQQIQNMQDILDKLLSIGLTEQEFNLLLPRVVKFYQEEFFSLTLELTTDFQVNKLFFESLERLQQETTKQHALQLENDCQKRLLRRITVAGVATVGVTFGLCIGMSIPASLASLLARSVAKLALPAVTGSMSGLVTAAVTQKSPQANDAQVLTRLTSQDQKSNLVNLLTSFIESGDEQTLHEMQGFFNHPKKICANLLKIILSEVAGGPAEDQIDMILQEADKREDGQIELQEFIKAMKAFRS
jgi:hypothetical protein